MSPYAQCNNNPVNRIDPDGNWSGKVHKKMIQTAVAQLNENGMNIDKKQEKAMIRGSRQADSFLRGNQSVKRSEIHNMLNPKISVEEAKDNAQKYVEKNMEKFEQTGNYKYLGRAAHTKMDETCPVHTDQNTGEPLKNDLGLNPKKWIEHIKGDKANTEQINKGAEQVKIVIKEGLGKNNPNQEQKGTD